MPERKKIIPTKFCIAIWVIPIIYTILFVIDIIHTYYSELYISCTYKEIKFFSFFYVPAIISIIINKINEQINIKEQYARIVEIVFLFISIVVLIGIPGFLILVGLSFCVYPS